jgi:flagellar hook-associated protein 3 FlgL
MTLRFTLANIQQFQENSEIAESLLKATDAALTGITEGLQKVRTIAVAAANSLSDEVRSSYLTELDGIKQRLMDLGNTQQADRYIFAGLEIDTKPFTPGVPPASVQYSGDNNQNLIWIQTGTSVESNVPGCRIFNIGGIAMPGSTDTFTLIDNLKANIMAGDTTVVSDQIKEIDDHMSNILSLHGEVGARSQRVEINAQVLMASYEQMSELLSVTEDIDMPSAVINLKTHENVYNAALIVTSRVMELSLVNYLK